MPPKIALVLSIVFVVYLFRIEGRKRIEISHALWLPLIWFMYCGSRAVSYWLYPETFMNGDNNAADGNPVDRVFLMGLIASGIFVLLKRKIKWQEIVGKNRWIFALFVYLGISVLWSGYMDISFKRWIRAIGDLIMVLIVVTEDDPLEAIQWLLLRCSFVLIPMSVVLVKYFRDAGVCHDAVSGTTMWIGVTTHKNQLGQLASIAAVNALWQIMNKWRQRDISFYNVAVIFVMALWLLNGPAISTSKTSILVFFLASTLLIISNYFKKSPKGFGRFVLFVGLTFYFLETMSEMLFSESLINLIVTSSGRDMTLTGRTDLWEELLKIGALHPIFGVGYGSFWISNIAQNLWKIFTWMPESAHNGYLDVYLELGLVGLIILFGTIIAVYKKNAKMMLDNFDFGRIGLTFIVMILIYNITESSFAKPTNLLWFLFLLFGIRGSEKVIVSGHSEVTPGF